LKSFRDFSPKRFLSFASALVLIVAAAWTISAKGALPYWISNIEAGTQLENAFFCTMPLPYGNVLYHRPPAETRAALGELIQQEPANAELYSLRALQDEQQLDFIAAERIGSCIQKRRRTSPSRSSPSLISIIVGCSHKMKSPSSRRLRIRARIPQRT